MTLQSPCTVTGVKLLKMTELMKSLTTMRPTKLAGLMKLVTLVTPIALLLLVYHWSRG